MGFGGNQIIELICSVLDTTRGSGAPELETEIVTMGYVGEALRELDKWNQIEVWRPMDRRYRVPTKDSFEAAIEYDDGDHRAYATDFFDCEDYTTRLRSFFNTQYRVNAVGTVITQAGTPHALNVVITADKTARLFEPQSDEFVSVGGSDDGRYDIDGAVFHV